MQIKFCKQIKYFCTCALEQIKCQAKFRHMCSLSTLTGINN